MVMAISMTIIDDDVGLEPDEVFPLRFTSADPRVMVGGQGLFAETRITIIDDDGKNIQRYSKLLFVCNFYAFEL